MPDVLVRANGGNRKNGVEEVRLDVAQLLRVLTTVKKGDFTVQAATEAEGVVSGDELSRRGKDDAALVEGAGIFRRTS